MGRKTKEDTLKTVAAILDAAESVFVEKGVAHATIADIADQAEVSRGAVYGHYKDKMAVCVAVCERAMAESHQIAALIPGEPAVEALKRVGMKFLKAIHTAPSLKNALEIIYIKCEKSTDYDPIQRFRLQWEKTSLRTISSLVRRAVEEGDFPVDLDLGLSAIHLQALLEGISGCIWFTDQLKPDPWPRVEKMLEAGIDAMRLSAALRTA